MNLNSKSVVTNNKDKLIHYIWFGNNNLPDFFINVLNSWKTYAPEYKIIKWTERELPVDINYYTKICWENKWYGHLSDFFRIYIVYHYGGLYLDIDLELIETVESSILEENYFVYVRNEDGIKNYGSGWSFRADKYDYNLLSIINAYNNFPKMYLAKYLKLPVWTDVTFMSPYIRQSLSSGLTETIEIEIRKIKPLIKIHHSASWVPKKEISRSNKKSQNIKIDIIKKSLIIRGYINTYGIFNGIISLISRQINLTIINSHIKNILR